MPGPRKSKKSGKRGKNRDHGGGVPERCDDMSVEHDEAHLVKQCKLPEETPNKDLLPYVIKTSDIMGRYLVASRDLKPGELIMSVEPLVVGPPQGCQPMCLGCYKKLNLEDDLFRCETCNWPMCCKKCPGNGKEYGHSESECRLYESARQKLMSADQSELTSLYFVVVPLRCLLLEKLDPEKYRIFLTMEAHNDIRRKITNIWRRNQVDVVDRIRKFLGFTQWEEELIHTVCGILEVNAFEVGQNEISIRALYPQAFYMAHDCIPNTGHTDDKKFCLRVRATTPIPKGSSINLSYAYTLQGTLKRQEHLKESKFFDCICARCSDPTELGTYAGALKCPKCGTGSVLSMDPLNNDAEWRCNNVSCIGYSVRGHSIKQLMERIGDEVEAMDENDVLALEEFLSRYKNVLHPNHYHFLGVLHSLSQLYGKAPGYIINTMTEAQLFRKRDICRQLLKVVDVLEPGYSRLRGSNLMGDGRKTHKLLLGKPEGKHPCDRPKVGGRTTSLGFKGGVLQYELHAPLMILITRGVEEQTLNYRDLRSRLKEVADCLEESSIILGFEPGTSHEGIMGSAAKEALIRVREWQKIITNG